jgi:hypothetical protein
MNIFHGPNTEILLLHHYTKLSFSFKVWNKTVITVVLLFEIVWKVYVILWLFRTYRISYISFIEVNNPSRQTLIPMLCYYSQISLCHKYNSAYLSKYVLKFLQVVMLLPNCLGSKINASFQRCICALMSSVKAILNVLL